jgi:hypothetical protein
MLIDNVQAVVHYHMSTCPYQNIHIFFMPLISAEDSIKLQYIFPTDIKKTLFLNYLIVSELFALFLHRTSDLEKVCHTCMEVKTYHCHRMHHLTLCHSRATCCVTSVLVQMAFHCWPLSNLGPLCHQLRMNGLTMTMWSFHLTSDADTATGTLHFNLIPSECSTGLMSIYRSNCFKSTM